MKKIFIMIGGFLVIIILALAGFTIQGRTIRQTELENAMNSSLEKTMKMISDKNAASPTTDEEMIAYFMEDIAYQIESSSLLTVNILEADVNKGILSVEGILTYKHPIGTVGHVNCKKTIILEQYKDNLEADQYTIIFMTGENVFKQYTLSEGSEYINPGIPEAEPLKTFAGWTCEFGTGNFDDLISGKTVEKDITFTAEFTE